MPAHIDRNSRQSSSWKEDRCGRVLPAKFIMSLIWAWGDRKGTPMTCVTFTLVKNFLVNKILSANYLCCILYSYAAQINRSRGEKTWASVFNFQNQTNFDIMMDTNNFLYDVNSSSVSRSGMFLELRSRAVFCFNLKSDAKFIVLFLSDRYFNNIQRILVPRSFTETTMIKLRKRWSKMEVYSLRRFMTYPPPIKKLHKMAFHNVFLDVKNNPANLKINFYTRCY